MVAANFVSGVVRDLTPHEGVQARILDALEDDDAHISVTHNKREKKCLTYTASMSNPAWKNSQLARRLYHWQFANVWPR